MTFIEFLQDNQVDQHLIHKVKDQLDTVGHAEIDEAFAQATGHRLPLTPAQEKKIQSEDDRIADIVRWVIQRVEGVPMRLQDKAAFQDTVLPEVCDKPYTPEFQKVIKAIAGRIMLYHEADRFCVHDILLLAKSGDDCQIQGEEYKCLPYLKFFKEDAIR